MTPCASWIFSWPVCPAQARHDRASRSRLAELDGLVSTGAHDSAVLVRGEPGIGKSALVERTAAVRFGQGLAGTPAAAPGDAAARVLQGMAG